MPHAVVEYSVNLREAADIPGLLEVIAEKLRDSGGVFPVGGIRVRAYAAEDYVIADGAAPDDAFIHVTIKIGAGRPDAFKRDFFGALFAAVEAHCAPVSATRGLALSLYVEEADEAGSFKHNTIHRRFAAKPAAPAGTG